ncbi:nickel pincer cofactor biosynthesis protein LarB [Deferribacter abyssi]|uniref:nickel pincer cofactor biosynthesis protein LarB n=1 Tax=Deferribacter abyssi TaxID=213806 RepID=UPI003C1330BD
MNKDILRILEELKSGKLDSIAAAQKIEERFILNHDEFHIDTHRRKRLGFDEVIYGKEKTINQLESIIKLYLEKDLRFFCTGLDNLKIDTLTKQFGSNVTFCRKSGTAKNFEYPPCKFKKTVGIITAGSSDAKVAYEAHETLKVLGVAAKNYIDVGVSGIHRFFKYSEDLEKHTILIVIAGMEGALPSVVGGLFRQPIIAVPTSVGYGTALGGFTPLFAMLTSCANGITVVNIDNGFGAAMAAFRILNCLSEAKHD